MRSELAPVAAPVAPVAVAPVAPVAVAPVASVSVPVALAALLLTALGCAPPEQPDPPPANPFPVSLVGPLQDAVDGARLSLGAPGAVLAVRLADGSRWVGTSGLADLHTGERVPVDGRFRIGSVTKTFTAATALLLEREGLLSLDDRVVDWLPWFTGNPGVTLEMALNHTSGVVNYTETSAFISSFDEAWTPREIVEAALAEPAYFAPGEGWTYSNTNFYLAGLVMEEATGEAWHALVRGRLLDPQGLAQTWAEAGEEGDVDIVRGYLDDVEVTHAFDPVWAWAAGCLVSSGDDLLTWGDALFAGDVLEAEDWLRMREPASYDGDGDGVVGEPGEVAPYGLGLYVEEREHGLFLGHTGSTMGFQSELYTLDGSGVVVAALVNDFTKEATTVAMAGWDVLVQQGVVAEQ